MFAQSILVLITFVWGGTFLVVQTALQWSGAYTLVGARFLIAALLLAAVLRGKLRGITRIEYIAGSLMGINLFFAYTLQTLGLQSISSSKSAFLAALYVPLVPVLQLLWFRKWPTAGAAIGIALAFVGLTLLASPGSMSLTLGKGEILTMLGTIAIAAEILLIAHFSPRCDPRRLAFVPLLVAGVLALLAAAGIQEPVPSFTPGLFACVGALALASALIQFGMNWAQRFVSATRATLIYAMEPVWAALVGAMAGERLGLWGLTGGAMIVLAVLVSELRFGRSSRPATV
ncbi:EamA-like transporter family protein [Polaromonas sp. OV174]|nr:EamA-like transporter family protein [Polaromonas sp. OV174]